MKLLFDVLAALAFAAYLAAAAASFWPRGTAGERRGRLAPGLAAAGFAAHTIALGVRIGMSGRLPVANSYEFLLTLAWATAGVFLILPSWVKAAAPGGPVLLLAALFLGVAVFLLPGPQKTVLPLPPALKSGWLAVHVLTAVLAYAAFAAGAGVAAVCLFRKDEGASRSLEEVISRVTFFGFAMLSLTIVCGAVWAEQAWGSYWSWDPKETWSLLTWIVYALYLHLRKKRQWRGKTSAAMVLLGFLLVMFTFFGVNYFMRGLHSYL